MLIQLSGSSAHTLKTCLNSPQQFDFAKSQQYPSRYETKPQFHLSALQRIESTRREIIGPFVKGNNGSSNAPIDNQVRSGLSTSLIEAFTTCLAAGVDLGSCASPKLRSVVESSI
jgi:hypothetical protein